MSPLIVADDAIASVREAFGPLGELRVLPGPEIDAAALRDASILLTRSVTQVDAALLRGSSVRLVASATAGIDHIDTAVLRELGVQWFHAPGCNARAVVEYVLTALFVEAARRPADWLRAGPVGIVGFGQIGRRLAAVLSALGLSYRVCDPPLQARLRGDALDPGFEAHPDLTALARAQTFDPLPELLRACPIVTLHVPLVRSGPWPTAHLIGSTELQQLGRGALLLNTSRGAVVDSRELQPWLRAGQGSAVLDVFEGEPALHWPLLTEAGLCLATPHIAGYTNAAKLRATQAIHRAVCRALGVSPFFEAATDRSRRKLRPPGSASSDVAVLAALAGQANPIADDDRELRAILDEPLAERPAAFEKLRRHYRLRPELAECVAEVTDVPAQTLPRPWLATLATLGLA